MKDDDDKRIDERLPDLIERLNETYANIREIVGPGVDTVFHARSGRSFVLPEAQVALHDLETQARAFAAERSAILDALPAQIALVDGHGTILAVNRMWRETTRSLTGAETPPPDVGINYLSVCDSATGQWAEGAADVAAGLRAVLSGGETRFSLEYPCGGDDGSHWFLLTVTALQPSEGSGAVVMHFDISARVQAQERAEQWRQRLANVIDEAQVGILVHRAWRPLLANREFARLVGASGADAITALESAAGLLPTEPGAAPTAGESGVVQLLTLGESGRQVERRSFTIPWDAEVAQVEMLTDVTLQRELEARLRQSQKMEAVGQLTGGVAHDFNNLLTVILGNAELLSEGLAEQSELLGFAELIAKAAERGAQLTNRLLSFSRQQPLSPVPTDVNALLVGMRDMLERILGEHIRIELRRDWDLHAAMIDPGQLEDAVLNLCLNARDAMPSGGYLVLETRALEVDLPGSLEAHDGALQPGRYVVLAVADTGVGMSEETLSRAFEPFFSTKEVGKGSGLGLSMIFGFLSQSGGHVQISSELGVGTRVSLVLPCARENAEKADEAQVRPAPM